MFSKFLINHILLFRWEKLFLPKVFSRKTKLSAIFRIVFFFNKRDQERSLRSGNSFLPKWLPEDSKKTVPSPIYSIRYHYNHPSKEDPFLAEVSLRRVFENTNYILQLLLKSSFVKKIMVSCEVSLTEEYKYYG